MEERRKRGREYSRHEGWKRGREYRGAISESSRVKGLLSWVLISRKKLIPAWNLFL
jgi:hypothetical protein